MSHMCTTEGGTHGRAHAGPLLTNTNTCPICCTAFKGIKNAKRHVMASVKRNYCSQGKALFEAVRSEPASLLCPVCESEAQAADILLEHCKQRLLELLPQSFHIREGTRAEAAAPVEPPVERTDFAT
eukprot:7160769-Pyramimonas_sp.AAC.1